MPSTKKWTIGQFEKIRDQVTSGLAETLDQKGSKEALQFAQSKIADLAQSKDSDEKLQRYTYIVAALVHHERFGGLGRSKISDLYELGLNILKSENIKPEGTRLSILYANLHLAMSQIYRRDGAPLHAAWELHFFERSAKATPDLPFSKIAFAKRVMRLGQVGLALSEIEQALQLQPEGTIDWQLWLHKIRALRLSGQYEAAEQTIQKVLAESQPGGDVEVELEWERAILASINTADLSELIKKTQKDKPHYLASYLVETFYRVNASMSKKWLDAVKPMRTISRYRDLDPKRIGPFFQCALQIEEANDPQIPFEVRLRSIQKSMFACRKLLTLERELLVMAAIIRWLVRNGNLRLAKLALGEYAALSSKASEGKSCDVLGLLSDLFDRKWYQNEKSP